MTDSRKSVVIVQTSMGDYRDEFIRALLDSTVNDYSITLYVGDFYYGKTTKTSQMIKDLNNRVKTINLLLGHFIGLQLFNYWRVIRSDVAILELNPRIINTWLIMVARKILRKRTILWGHVWSRSGKHSRTEYIRSIMRDYSDGVLLYTSEQKRELMEKRGVQKANDIYVAANSLYSVEQIYSEPPTGSSFVYVGRLVESKKPIQLVQAFVLAALELPEKVKLHLVGAGPLEKDIAEIVRNARLSGRVVTHGHIGNYEALRAIYAECVFSVSPGYVGLSAIQSLSFGRPILVSRDEPHAPELAALESAVNAVFFKTDDVNALAQEMRLIIDNRATWEARFNTIADTCGKDYSVQTMVDGFRHAIEG